MMCLSVALTIALEQRYRWASRVSGAMIALVFSMAMANLGVIPTRSVLYDDIVWGFFVPPPPPRSAPIFPYRQRKGRPEGVSPPVPFWDRDFLNTFGWRNEGCEPPARTPERKGPVPGSAAAPLKSRDAFHLSSQSDSPWDAGARQRSATAYRNAPAIWNSAPTFPTIEDGRRCLSKAAFRFAFVHSLWRYGKIGADRAGRGGPAVMTLYIFP